MGEFRVAQVLVNKELVLRCFLDSKKVVGLFSREAQA